MLFTELRFFVFFAVVFCGAWGLASNRARKLWLLAASYVFYAAWDWRFLSLIAFSTGLDFTVGLALGRIGSGRARKVALAASLAGNLGLLGVFKYFDFFVESAAGLLDLVGVSLPVRTLGLVLPVGISFYTFQTLSYTIDVYRRRRAPVRDLPDFALFVGFFPQLVAGPIVRSTEFLPQLVEKRRFRDVDVRRCLTLFLVGFVKKACVSDHFAGVVDPVFADPSAYDAASNWLALVLWHAQIYCDFSGYSDMAIGTAGLLGYRLPVNFDFPYFARSLEEFWSRWHISLSTWLRDYLYQPLRGAGGGPSRAMGAATVTMLLCGLWHGAGWQYVGFGALMAAGLVASRLWRTALAADHPLRRAVAAASPALLTLFLFANWIVFRSVGGAECARMFGVVSFLEPGGSRAIGPFWWACAAAAALAHAAARAAASRSRERGARLLPDGAYAALYGAAAAVALFGAAVDARPFVYFQF